jgi:hypothetical protein
MAIAAPAGSLPTAPALMRLAAPRSLHNRTERGVIGSPRVMTEGLSPWSRLLRPTSPVAFQDGFILPRASLPFRARRRATCLRNPPTVWRRSSAPEAPPMGFGWALFATSASRSHLPQGANHSLLRSVLGVPPALDGLLPDQPCGFVPPRSRVQGSRLPGACPSHGAVPAFTGRCLLAVATCRPAVSRARRPTTSSEALLPASSAVTEIDGLDRPLLRSPHRLLLLRVLPPRAVAAFAASALGLPCNEPAARSLRRLASAEPGWPVFRLPTRPRSPA